MQAGKKTLKHAKALTNASIHCRYAAGLHYSFKVSLRLFSRNLFLSSLGDVNEATAFSAATPPILA